MDLNIIGLDYDKDLTITGLDYHKDLNTKGPDLPQGSEHFRT
jgi:hypothetical protein